MILVSVLTALAALACVVAEPSTEKLYLIFFFYYSQLAWSQNLVQKNCKNADCISFFYFFYIFATTAQHISRFVALAALTCVVAEPSTEKLCFIFFLLLLLSVCGRRTWHKNAYVIYAHTHTHTHTQ